MTNREAGEAAFEAGRALGELGEAARRSPVQSAWMLRETAHVAATLTARRFGPARAQDLFAIVAGSPGTRAFASEELLTALAFWRHGLKRWVGRPLPSPWERGDEESDLLPDVEEDAWLERTDADDPVAALTDALSTRAFIDVLGMLHAKADRNNGVGALELAVPLVLAEHAGAVLPTVALASPRRRRRRDGQPGWVETARQLAAEAAGARARLGALEAAWFRWANALPPRRADSRVDDVVRLLARAPMLTAPGVAEILAITRTAATAHLKVLKGCGIVREVTGRARWQLFCPTDLPMTQWATRGAQQSPRHQEAPGVSEATHLVLASREGRRPVNLEAIDRMLNDAYNELEKAVTRVEGSLDRQ